MNKTQDQLEATNPEGASGAHVSCSAAGVEKAEAHGRFKATLTGPVESFREEYCALRDRLTRKGLTGVFDRLLHGRKLLADFLAIPTELKWAEEFDNIVTTVGKNLALDTFLAGSAYTVVGPYLGLINTNASSAVVGDTMASHAGWLEVGNANAPTYTAPRKTVAWSAAAAGSKATSAALSYAIGSSGTVGGCFLVFGSGAVSTIDSTAGTLYSAGAFTGGSKTVGNGDTLAVTYTASL